MMTFVKGNIFQSPAKVLVNTVNTVGVMGKGIAKTFKDVYPDMFKTYQQLCESKKITIGKLYLYKTNNKWILNFPTKTQWRQPAKLEFIEAGLNKFISTYAEKGISSIAFPRLGCGNGELDWDNQVKPLMINKFKNLPIDIFIYEYNNGKTVPEHRETEMMYRWLRSEPRSLPFDEMWSDLCTIIGQGLLIPAIGVSSPIMVYVRNNKNTGIQLEFPDAINFLKKILPYKLRIQVRGLNDVFIPQEALRELWDITRTYGYFCSRIMPEGLDVIAPYMVAILSHLKYTKRLVFKWLNNTNEIGLSLYTMPTNATSSNEIDHVIKAA